MQPLAAVGENNVGFVDNWRTFVGERETAFVP